MVLIGDHGDGDDDQEDAHAHAAAAAAAAAAEDDDVDGAAGADDVVFDADLKHFSFKHLQP